MSDDVTTPEDEDAEAAAGEQEDAAEAEDDEAGDEEGAELQDDTPVETETNVEGQEVDVETGQVLPEMEDPENLTEPLSGPLAEPPGTVEQERRQAEEDNIDTEKVEALVSDLKAEDLVPMIEDAGPRKLEVLKAAEEAGKARKGVLAAVASRELVLQEQHSEYLSERVKPAPVGELLSPILNGYWVRFGSGEGVPPEATGRDGTVTFAPYKISQGQDSISQLPYEYQDGDEIFTVRLRDTGGLVQCTRDAFQAWAPEQAQLLQEVYA